MRMVSFMYNKYKIFLIFSLFCVLSLCAGERVSEFFNLEETSYDIDVANIFVDNPANAFSINDSRQSRISEFNNYIVNLLHTSSYEVPSSSNIFTERSQVQYRRVRRSAENNPFSFRFKPSFSEAINVLSFSKDKHRWLIYNSPCDYFIYTLNRLRI